MALSFKSLWLLGLLLASSGEAQDWHAYHFAGYPVPTSICAGDVATLPIPVPGSNIRLVSTLTTTNTPCLLGNLLGNTISATVWMECSNNPAFFFNNDCGNGVASNMRLFFTSDIRPYTETHGKQDETAYWWANAETAWAPVACGTNTLTANVTPKGWSDSLGHLASDSNYTSDFLCAAAHVAQVGFSIGGGCYYDNGVGVSNTGAAAILHVLRFDVQTLLTLQALAGSSVDGPWTMVGVPIYFTNLTSQGFFKLLIYR